MNKIFSRIQSVLFPFVSAVLSCYQWPMEDGYLIYFFLLGCCYAPYGRVCGVRVYVCACVHVPNLKSELEIRPPFVISMFNVLLSPRKVRGSEEKNKTRWTNKPSHITHTHVCGHWERAGQRRTTARMRKLKKKKKKRRRREEKKKKRRKEKQKRKKEEKKRRKEEK